MRYSCVIYECGHTGVYVLKCTGFDIVVLLYSWRQVVENVGFKDEEEEIKKNRERKVEGKEREVREGGEGEMKRQKGEGEMKRWR